MVETKKQAVLITVEEYERLLSAANNAVNKTGEKDDKKRYHETRVYY